MKRFPLGRSLSALRTDKVSVFKSSFCCSYGNTLLAKSYNLTCVDMKIKSVAIAAMDLMEYALHGSDSTPRHVSITPSIVVRKSCRQL